MLNQKYEIEKHSVSTILSWIKTKEVVVPEIQRPFVWKNTQVRDLIDSLYNGFPVGYLIVSRSHDMRLKDGTLSKGQRILIDGQQRVTALMAAIMGKTVLNSNYQERKVKIAFNPLAKEDEQAFEVQAPAHVKSNIWVEDISIFFDDSFDDFEFIDDYCSLNPEVDKRELNKRIKKLIDIKTKDLGVIELSSDLDMDTVSDVFIRINSKGTVLSQADFAMSKISSDEKFGGNNLRKAIDYFCNIIQDQSFYDTVLKNDPNFANSTLGKEMTWLKNTNDLIYTPSYDDVLRVSFVHMFSRGKLKDLVSLLSGRDFESRDYKEEIAEKSFSMLTDGIRNFMHQYYYEQFMLAIKNAGFISDKLISSQNALNFAYVVFIKLATSGEVEKTEIKRYVSKWLVMSILTGRYSSSPESKMDHDIRNINERGVINCLEEIEKAELSDSFWEFKLPQMLNTPSSSSPALSTFFAAQIILGDKGLFSSTSTIRDLYGVSDVHHIFPKAYLQSVEYLNNKSIYNQVANYTLLDTPINIAIGKKAPNEYFKEAFTSAETSGTVYGQPMSLEELKDNLIQNCIPLEIIDWDYKNYLNLFLEERRKLMAKKIEKYYHKL